jgi:drug/metabolite transporter (DMT)-like permease
MDKSALGSILTVTSILGIGLYGVSFKYISLKRLHLPSVNVGMYVASTTAIAIAAMMLGGFPHTWQFFAFGIAMGLGAYGFVSFLRVASSLGSTAICWTITQMAIVMPFLASFLVYHELPKWNHWLGLAITGVGVAMLGADVKEKQQ